MSTPSAEDLNQQRPIAVGVLRSESSGLNGSSPRTEAPENSRDRRSPDGFRVSPVLVLTDGWCASECGGAGPDGDYGVVAADGLEGKA